MDSKTKQKTVVVVGAGFAGAAIAFHLTRLGMERVFVLEREKFPGMHASGKNAAMIRQVVPNKLISDLARGGAAFLRNLPLDWPVETKFEQNGSFFLASKKDSEKIQQDGAYAKQYGTLTEWWPIERIIEFIPSEAASSRTLYSSKMFIRGPGKGPKRSDKLNLISSISGKVNAEARFL